MGYETEFYTQSEVTWDVALKVSYVLNDSFRHDFLRSEYWSEKYDLRRVPLLPGYHPMMRNPTFNLVTHHFARLLYLQARANSRLGIVLAKDVETQEYVAFACVTLPKYSPPFKPEESSWLWRKIKILFLACWFRLQDIWAFKSLRNPLFSPEMKAEFATGVELCSAHETPERMADLKAMDRKQLNEVAYPKPWSYYLNLYAVVTEQQGKGLGRKFMDTVLDTLRSKVEIQEPPEFPGPAKFQLFASPIGAPFYKRYGFSLGASAERVQPSGRTLVHSYFYLNLT